MGGKICEWLTWAAPDRHSDRVLPDVSLLLLPIPLLLWALAARTRRGGIRTAALLALIAAAQLVLGFSRILPSARVTLLAALAITAIAVLILGMFRESQAPDRRTSRVGRVVAGAFCILWAPALLLLILVAWIDGSAPLMPSADAVLPLPAGLTVTQDTDWGCGRLSEGCDRVIAVSGPAGASPQEVMHQISAALHERHGWNVIPNTDGDCRRVGLLLDRQSACVIVGDDDGTVTIRLSVRPIDQTSVDGAAESVRNPGLPEEIGVDLVSPFPG